MSFPEMFEWDGPLDKHPQLSEDRFHLWLQQEDPERLPFPLLPMPAPKQMERLLEAVGWTEYRSAFRFKVPISVLRSWCCNSNGPQDNQFEYTRVGAQAAWSALAYAAKLPPAPGTDESEPDESGTSGDAIITGGERLYRSER